MNLNTRFFLLRLAIFTVFTLLTWLGLTQVSEQINEQWGRQFAQRQVLFDKHRTLSPLIQEIRLARKMASEPALIRFAHQENDADTRAEAIKIMGSM